MITITIKVDDSGTVSITRNYGLGKPTHTIRMIGTLPNSYENACHNMKDICWVLTCDVINEARTEHDEKKLKK